MPRPVPTLATLAHRVIRVYWRLAKLVTFGVRAIVRRGDERLLLVKHTYDHRWYLPDGGRKRHESAEVALARELREEVGIADLRLVRKLGTYQNSREGKRDTIEVFIGRADEVGRLQRREIAACEWFDPRELPMDASPGTGRRIAEFLGQRPIGCAW